MRKVIFLTNLNTLGKNQKIDYDCEFIRFLNFKLTTLLHLSTHMLNRAFSLSLVSFHKKKQLSYEQAKGTDFYTLIIRYQLNLLV